MTPPRDRLIVPLLLCLALLGGLLLASCSDKGVSIQKNENASRLVGTWLLKARLIDGKETPATERYMKLQLKDDETFRSWYRGEASQPWISAGQGAFSYDPPHLSLHWDSGATVTLLVTEKGPETLEIHHGRNVVPLKDQDPPEVFVRQKPQTGPTRGPS